MRTPDQNPLTDRKTLIAIAVVIVFMVAWQHYMTTKYPPAAHTQTPIAAPAQDPRAVSNPAEPNLNAVPRAEADVKNTAVMKPEELLTYEDDRIRFTLSSHGMGLKEYIVKDYKQTDGEPIRLGFSPLASLFEVRWVDSSRPLVFEVRQTAEGRFEGVARESGMVFRRELFYDAGNRSFQSALKVDGVNAEISRGLGVMVPDTIHVAQNSSIFFPSYDHQDFFVSHGGKTESVNFNHAKENIRRDFTAASLVSVGNQYFTSVVLDQSEIAPDVVLTADLNQKTALAELIYKPLKTAGELAFHQVFYAGPKSIDVLKKINPAMENVIDFGYLAVIAKPLLYVMKWFHSMIPNWGVAIILLTLLVRFAVLPFNLMSMRSMKAMQKIQPHINQLRERHKEDPMTLNREMMALMKEHKANPLGGCLPMLIQIPIFFALFRVIGSSVELYQSPFAFWIHDLSLHDPFYVLPVLMGVTMYLQQKLTPTTMDPAQAKIMQFLPLVFTVFMLQLPSGLTLYMVVSSVFGIIQQYFILKDSKALVPAKTK
ncbi:MAG: membrane protein insertase YidC [Bdellovibrionaceae bacterium]|nr:membrane protein insertase YidC [Pseudobdellovibrionaceae bacterium]MBX3033652.1 membrane protein insertase YidC [Pseudobdellovibrionaceae bacterium]